MIRYELAEECADDDEDRASIRKLRKLVLDQYQDRDSVARVSFPTLPRLIVNIIQGDLLIQVLNPLRKS